MKEIWIKVFVQRKQSYGDLSVRLARFAYGDLGRSFSSAGTQLRRSKCSPKGISVMEI